MLPGEYLSLCIRQCKFWVLGGSVSSPVVVVATNKRLIIISKMLFGIRHDYEVLDYKQIIGLRVIRGILTSSIFIKSNSFQGSHEKDDRSNSMISGIYTKDEEMLFGYLNSMLAQTHHPLAVAQANQGGLGTNGTAI